MGSSRRRSAGQREIDEQDARGQEVLRATRELAAYFKGRRTEREARSAVKIIKAFIRDRERIPPASRRPLPGSTTAVARTNERKPLKASGRSDTKKRRRPKSDVIPAPFSASPDEPAPTSSSDQ